LLGGEEGGLQVEEKRIAKRRRYTIEMNSRAYRRDKGGSGKICMDGGEWEGGES
jgi:hypothetical protein